jgi:hypothetical protein
MMPAFQAQLETPHPTQDSIGYHDKIWDPIVGHGGVDCTLCTDIHFSAQNGL